MIKKAVKPPYINSILIKRKKDLYEGKYACFGGITYTDIDYFLLDIDETLTIDDVKKYFNFIYSIIPNLEKAITIEIIYNKIKVLLNDNFTKYIPIDKIKILSIFTLLRYIQEYPEIVSYLVKNGFSWSNLEKAHIHWNNFRSACSTVKYNNLGHAIHDSSYTKLLEKFCDQEVFTKRFKDDNTFSYLRNLFSKA